MAIPIPDDVRKLLQAPNYVHLPTLRADGSPRNWWRRPRRFHLFSSAWGKTSRRHRRSAR